MLTSDSIFRRLFSWSFEAYCVLGLKGWNWCPHSISLLVVFSYFPRVCFQYAWVKLIFLLGLQKLRTRPSTFLPYFSCFGGFFVLFLFFFLIQVRQAYSIQKLMYLAVIEKIMYKENRFPEGLLTFWLCQTLTCRHQAYMNLVFTNYRSLRFIFSPQGFIGLAYKILFSIQNVSYCLYVLDTIKTYPSPQSKTCLATSKLICGTNL